ncbi:MAG: YeeE/YedE family protein [Promethearchaeota archaeon]|jgi:uncharacterized membrane protein YedE/YeeE
MPDLFLTVIAGILIGIIFGFVLQRGRFCMNSAFRDIILLKDRTLIKAVAIAIVVQMILFHLMDALDIITLNPKPLVWGGNIIGGFIFGIGMVLAAGCASGTTYRVGEGMMGSLMALLAFAIGGYTTKFGFLKPFKDDLQSATKITTENGGNPTLGNILGSELESILTWGIVILIAAISIYIIITRYYVPWKNDGNQLNFSNLLTRIFTGTGWKWWVTGIVIGLIGCVAFISSAAAGRNYPLGITGGWVGFLGFFLTGDEGKLSWEAFLVVGAVIGAFIAAKIAGEFKLRAPKEGKQLFLQFGGGLLMGIGAVTAAGCNIGNTLSGIPQLSLGSILATIFFILGNWVTAYLLFGRE